MTGRQQPPVDWNNFASHLKEHGFNLEEAIHVPTSGVAYKREEVPKTKRKWEELKRTGNELFKAGQYGEATKLYSQAIKELEKTGKGKSKSPEDLSIIYSNRAASYLKDGKCELCIQDCNTSLDLVPFNVKSLFRRAAAYEALERHRLAYVDYKTALAVDNNIASAHDGASRMSKVLMEVDGPSWREKLPPIPTVTLTMKQAMLNACHQGRI